eukprot:CAMPEP_0201494104 /NCGR_PEP_ID=MMETSP0151_2-20130828/45057_1 /ASSEMBLY_ACC=CAM_ASM_000257 /TAXON_ID=200890 /ORGANISM="Paramoeba atlantica, Strain 621/1 / CCAP 1560/9" /LENGTH=36 /DNA_ID= /DNA_START= /DNA_END= /DNA_ORIENTATION=
MLGENERERKKKKKMKTKILNMREHSGGTLGVIGWT